MLLARDPGDDFSHTLNSVSLAKQSKEQSRLNITCHWENAEYLAYNERVVMMRT